MLVWTSPLRDDAGNITHVMEMSTDITQMRRLQDQMAHLGSVIGSLSHGIKGLLTGLDGGMYLLDSGFDREDMPRIKEGWDVVRLMIGRIRGLVQDILTYAKGRDISWEKMDVLSLVRDLETAMRPKTEQAGINLDCRFDPGLADYQIDIGIARAILTNVLDNALEACATEVDPSKAHMIQFIAEKPSQDIVFKVIDNGPGMRAETLSKIFTPHFLSRKENGSGLGLYLAYRILQTIQGHISVDSSVGKGTCFEIYMPNNRRNDMSV
jgi:signal transduction histidine kinase